MSKAPQNLIDARRYLRATTGRGSPSFGIRGFVGKKRDDGYHLGRRDMEGPGGRGLHGPANPRGDYSSRRPRDQAGLTPGSNWASALDISGPVPELKQALAKMVQLAKAGKLDVMELIGPNANGDATDYRRPLWKPLVRKDPNKRDGHRSHIHMSFPRDITNPSLPSYEPSLARQLEPVYGPAIEEPADPPTLRLGDSGPAVGLLQERLNDAGAMPALVVDQDFGPITEAAVRAFQRDAGLTDDGIAGPLTWDALEADTAEPDEETPESPTPPTIEELQAEILELETELEQATTSAQRGWAHAAAGRALADAAEEGGTTIARALASYAQAVEGPGS
jgi:hypothetical protein